MGFKTKLRDFKDCTVNSMIYKAYYNDDLDDNLVYLESRDGLDFTGNIFRIVEELSTGKYGDLKIYVHAKPQAADKIKAFKKNYHLKIDKIITKEATATKVLEKAKYIFTDAGIRPKYVKKKGQIFINTWHGTPLKVMGRDNVGEEHRLANAQHAMLSSDYLLYPNLYMNNIMLDAYDIDKIYSGKILLEGYPRNSVFYKESWLKEKLGLSDKKIFVYMPTFRGVLMDRDDNVQKDDVERYLGELDSRLKDNQILFAKLHVLNASKIDFNKFKHIMPFPEDYETYDVLNMADALITDYSSVFFDFANTKRKIILFNYDEDDYDSYRGIYIPMSDLPFPKVQTVDELARELNNPSTLSYNDFFDEYCRFDNPDAASRICDHIFNGNKICYERTIENNKPNILIYVGSLNKTNVSLALFNLLNNVNRDKYNFFITYRQWDENINENHEEIFKLIPDDVGVLPIRFSVMPTIREKMDYDKFFSSKVESLPESLEKLYRRSFEKQFGSVKWDMLIDFDGCDMDEALMFASSGVKTAVWIHYNMLKEIKYENINRNAIKHVYSKSFKYVVSPTLKKSTDLIANNGAPINVVHSFHDYNSVYEKATENYDIDSKAIIYPEKNLQCVLNKNVFKFISVGEFSTRNGYERLIDAFNQFCTEYPDSQLIIIGQDAGNYSEICRAVDESSYSENITLIRNLYDYIPILKECDLFIMPSYNEAWPLTLMQADSLCVPTISVEVGEMHKMGSYSGSIVDNSTEGILEGMHDFVKGDVCCSNSDFIQHNNSALHEFYNMLDK